MHMTIMDGYVHQKELKVHPKTILDDYKRYSTFFIFAKKQHLQQLSFNPLDKCIYIYIRCFSTISLWINHIKSLRILTQLIKISNLLDYTPLSRFESRHSHLCREFIPTLPLRLFIKKEKSNNLDFCFCY